MQSRKIFPKYKDDAPEKHQIACAPNYVGLRIRHPSEGQEQQDFEGRMQHVNLRFGRRERLRAAIVYAGIDSMNFRRVIVGGYASMNEFSGSVESSKVGRAGLYSAPAGSYAGTLKRQHRSHNQPKQRPFQHEFLGSTHVYGADRVVIRQSPVGLQIEPYVQVRVGR